MEKAAVYLRISKEDLDREGDSHSKSIENQRIIVTDYALKHGWSIQQYLWMMIIQACIMKDLLFHRC